MKHRNKKEVLDIIGDYVKVGEKQCRNCVSSDKSTISKVKIKCTLSKPETTFCKNHEIGWICYSFSRKCLNKNEVNNGKKKRGI